MANGTARYSDDDLIEFKTLVDTKLTQANEQLQSLQDQILEITENAGDEHGGDWMDDSSINNEVEMLNTMAIRQRKYIKDLENALIRIKNKTYGICVITGELIEKRRLLAVPTTTKSVMAKNEEQKKADEKSISPVSKATPYVKKTEESSGPKIITKVIKKSGGAKPVAPSKDDDDDDFDLSEFDLGSNLDLKMEKSGIPKDDLDEFDTLNDDNDTDIDDIDDDDDADDDDIDLDSLDEEPVDEDTEDY
ncbi:MAG: TraR/DksA family transcriptional regulator [Lewinellaceae bacterium]|nr:TraR/DksA family transcriptional regulator [Lewinella sp.]MCB9281412.1 TraR/DksA family transcriptional regulator [Lewinellaceae bacterium]